MDTVTKFPKLRPRIWDFNFDAWGKCDPAKIERRSWIYGKHYLAGALSATIADGGIGKSILSLTEAIAIVMGRPLLGEMPNPPVVKDKSDLLSVFYYNAEESLDEIKRRVCAICQHFGIDLAELDTGLNVASGHDFPLVIGTASNGKVEFNDFNLGCLKNSHADVIILDPFISVHQCPENDNNTVDAVVKRLSKLAATSPIQSVALVHHSRKASGAIDGSDARGASAIYDGVREMRVLNPMSETEARRAKVDDPRWYFRMDSGVKANYSAPSSTSTWFRHKSIILPNGDDVGVIVPWKAPGPLDDITREQVNQVRELASGGYYQVDSQSKTWIGNAVGDVLGLDSEDAVEREQIKTVLKKWYTDGVLKKVQRRGKDRHLTMVATSSAREQHNSAQPAKKAPKAKGGRGKGGVGE